MKYKIWDKQEDLYTPVGTRETAAEVLAAAPLAGIAEFIICDAPINKGVFMEFEQTKAHYKKMIRETKLTHPDWPGYEIADEMSYQEVLDAISFWEEHPPQSLPSSEERIAAAMEFQNLMSL